MKDKIPFEVRCIIPFIGWLDKHPVVHKIILALMGAAIVVAAFFYNFTTNN